MEALEFYVGGEWRKSGRTRPVVNPYEGKTVAEVYQAAPEDIEKVLPGIDFDGGLIRTQGETLATSRKGIFAGGDLVRGPSTVVAAVADGMKAAKEIDLFLQK